MRSVESSSVQLRTHIESTYLSLRIGIAAIGVTLPVVLWAVGLASAGLPLQGSMSAYYHTALRDVFVGALCAVGVALYLYKGFSTAENVALNAAGAFAVCVALFPTRSSAEWTLVNYVHVGSAVLFFMCLAYVSVFRASDTLSLVRNTGRARLLQLWYRILGIGMVMSPLFAVAAAWLLRPAGEESSTVFFLEAFGAWAFGAYWLVKSWELNQSTAERAAAQGILVAAPKSTRESAVPGTLIQIAPLDESIDDIERRLDAGRLYAHNDDDRSSPPS